MTREGYLSGFGNHHESEVVAGVLPVGRNSPQNVAHGLYAEQFSGTAFTVTRGENRRSWLYRMRPSAAHRPYAPYVGNSLVRSGPLAEVEAGPNRQRWDPLPLLEGPSDFIDGMVTYAHNGDPGMAMGVSIHLYAANRSMEGRCFCSVDGELLIVPQMGALRIATEMGLVEAAPGQIALIPRGVRFRVKLTGDTARGYICENHGEMFRLPQLGPIGANGLASARDFEAPVAWYEDSDAPVEIIQKFSGRLWTTTLDHSPLDVVAWHGNHAPYRYDLGRFNTLGSVSFDHPDPSIFTVLTSPGSADGTANCDFVIFPPRWVVAEDTFRPPWFHRNVMSEFMGLLRGQYDAKAEGFAPGGASLHNCMAAHGPDRASYEAAVEAELKPQRIEDTLAFMFESRFPFQPTRYAMECSHRQTHYDDCWQGFAKARVQLSE